ncbi:hypothetical protein AGR9A_Cc120399 [Agrobacterium salinitolerans str. Hayward 0363]|nr:hypothetical protein AGR9A_Cc120399 [Agrobacterium salinitolerans str. Hayward 0363]
MILKAGAQLAARFFAVYRWVIHHGPGEIPGGSSGRRSARQRKAPTVLFNLPDMAPAGASFFAKKIK